MGSDSLLEEVLIPFLSTCKTLGIGKDYMRHHTPWAKQLHLDCSRWAGWNVMISYLYVTEGWQLSDFSDFLGRQGTIKACLQFPQLVEGSFIHLLLEYSSLIRFEGSDFGPVSKAILAKGEAKLRELISLDYDLGEQDPFGWTPLHLSVYWPLGMEILLAAGVQHNRRFLGHTCDWIREPMAPLQYAIVNRQDEAILLLLNTDSVLNYRHQHVLAQLMRYDYEPSSRVVTATIEAMAQRSNRLRSLAIAHLPPGELNRLCISHEDDPIHLLDAYAAPTANALKNLGVEIPEALGHSWVEATVYHDQFPLGPEFLDWLWSSGLHDTNVYNMDGFTPLHQACLLLDFDMANWLMSHGGDPTTVVRGHSLNTFHLLSQRFSDCVSYCLHQYQPCMDIVTRIAGLCGADCRGDCRCACSPQGCTPTTVLFRRAPRTWVEKKGLFLLWTRLLDLSPNTMETCCLGLARLETFEREWASLMFAVN